MNDMKEETSQRLRNLREIMQREHLDALRDDEFDREHGIKPAAKERQCLHFVPLLELIDLFLILQDPLDLVGRVGVFELLHQILQGVAA